MHRGLCRSTSPGSERAARMWTLIGIASSNVTRHRRQIQSLQVRYMPGGWLLEWKNSLNCCLRKRQAAHKVTITPRCACRDAFASAFHPRKKRSYCEPISKVLSSEVPTGFNPESPRRTNFGSKLPRLTRSNLLLLARIRHVSHRPIKSQ